MHIFKGIESLLLLVPVAVLRRLDVTQGVSPNLNE